MLLAIDVGNTNTKFAIYDAGKEVHGLLCRIAGYVPPAAPGRKPKAKA